jgi:hypothetical protein
MTKSQMPEILIAVHQENTFKAIYIDGKLGPNGDHITSITTYVDGFLRALRVMGYTGEVDLKYVKTTPPGNFPAKATDLKILI